LLWDNFKLEIWCTAQREASRPIGGACDVLRACVCAVCLLPGRAGTSHAGGHLQITAARTDRTARTL